ncbi:helix-turn-helix domain-containing protein [Paenibacillus protaetiae]|uniref:AraC family transcriptional regulator n=1 Tax=Paenibacillus protaetiae TaxID=2509456 RepID=A0A4P6EX67_9BACL|nr:helix-turn-helix domain-containing protein [Paenibacillus protaetiae]QAY67632.1 AraC family transcriptional regulator [Paenibacillus protaetiae]
MRSLSFLSKMTIFGLLLATLPVLFIGTFSYLTSSSEIQKNVNAGKNQLLMQINSNVEQKLITVNQTLNQVINSTVMKKALTRPINENDFIMYNDLRNEIRYMQSFDTRLEDVILINAKYNWMIKNSGLYPFDQYSYYNQLAGLMKLPDTTSWVLNPSDWFYSEENKGSNSCSASISLVKKLPVTGPDPYGLAIANIPACSIQDLLNADGTALSGIMILDDTGRIVLHADHNLIGQPVSRIGLSDLTLLHGASGQYKTAIGPKPYSVTYYRSELNGWVYATYDSIASMTKQSNKIGLYTIYICTAMLLICLVVAWIGSRRMYSPIELLLNQFGHRKAEGKRGTLNEFQLIGEQVSALFQSKSRLEDEVRKQLKQVRTFFLMRAFQGKAKTKELNDRLEQFGYSSQLAEWRTMSVIAIQIGALDQTKYSKQDTELLLFAIQNMVEELIPAEQQLAPVVIDHTVAALIGSPEGDPALFQQAIYSSTEQLMEQITGYLSLQVSIGMSLPFRAVKAMPTAYKEALEALKHRMTLGDGLIIQFESINSGKPYLKLNYPVPIESELMDAIKLAHAEPAKELLNRLLAHIFTAEMSPQDYQIPLTRLLNQLLMMMQESGIGLKQIYYGTATPLEELLDCRIVAEIEDWFWSKVIVPMMKVYRDRQEEQYHNISEKIIDMIQRDYATDLTLEECASRLHYNANYLSSVFRKETNYSFSEYLSAYRFTVAKKWLSETDIPIKDIAARLRYNNSQNFIRSFRKQEGLTPGQYREKTTLSPRADNGA